MGKGEEGYPFKNDIPKDEDPGCCVEITHTERGVCVGVTTVGI